MYHAGVYYLYGEIKKGKTWLVPGQDWEDYRWMQAAYRVIRRGT